jgi:hypothetical protein
MNRSKGIRMQSVKFKSIDDFLTYIPDHELKVVNFLRGIIFDCIPDASEKLAYNVPFYKRHKNICFLWPAAVLWGKRQTYEGVRLGFTQGYLLADETNFLEKGNRKQVYWKDFTNIRAIDVELLRAFLFEAVLIDGQLGIKPK